MTARELEPQISLSPAPFLKEAKSKLIVAIVGLEYRVVNCLFHFFPKTAAFRLAARSTGSALISLEKRIHRTLGHRQLWMLG